MKCNPHTAPAIELMTTRQAAAAFAVTPTQVRRLARQGRVFAIPTGPRTTVFDRRDVERFAALRVANPPKPGRPKEKF